MQEMYYFQIHTKFGICKKHSRLTQLDMDN